MKAILLNQDGRKTLYTGNVLPSNACYFTHENVEVIQELEFDDLKMIIIDEEK